MSTVRNTMRYAPDYIDSTPLAERLAEAIQTLATIRGQAERYSTNWSAAGAALSSISCIDLNEEEV